MAKMTPGHPETYTGRPQYLKILIDNYKEFRGYKYMSTTFSLEGQTTNPRRWKIGDVTVTKIVEFQSITPIAQAFPKATVAAVLALPWLQPHFLTPEGDGIFSFHALVVDTPAKRIIVDTCVGNDKNRMPWANYHQMQNKFLADLEAAGFPRESFDVVLCTHLHVDHVGWNTILVDGKWVPTFPNARYLLNKTEYEYWMADLNITTEGGWDEVQRLTMSDSIAPIMAAGKIDLVEGIHPVCDEVSLIPTVGHSPGHVSVRIRSRGEEALITGDMTHHPCQLAHIDWGITLDFDSAQAAQTRRDVFADSADRSVLVIGTHWAGATAGRIVRNGDTYRLEC
jgi:glyoxylase-like metal-dependent hydrolase (beta-lactamase superfamily II)